LSSAKPGAAWWILNLSFPLTSATRAALNVSHIQGHRKLRASVSRHR
jgi:hypothetical protein